MGTKVLKGGRSCQGLEGTYEVDVPTEYIKCRQCGEQVEIELRNQTGCTCWDYFYVCPHCNDSRHI